MKVLQARIINLFVVETEFQICLLKLDEISKGEPGEKIITIDFFI